jgi:hypothetical protein
MLKSLHGGACLQSLAYTHPRSTHLIGISSGAIIILEALISKEFPLKSIQKAVIFEPPLMFRNNDPSKKNLVDISQLIQFEKHLSSETDETIPALTRAMLLSQMGYVLLHVSYLMERTLGKASLNLHTNTAVIKATLDAVLPFCGPEMGNITLVPIPRCRSEKEDGIRKGNARSR